MAAGNVPVRPGTLQTGREALEKEWWTERRWADTSRHGLSAHGQGTQACFGAASSVTVKTPDTWQALGHRPSFSLLTTVGSAEEQPLALFFERPFSW